MQRLPATGMVRTGVNNLFHHEDIEVNEDKGALSVFSWASSNIGNQ
jgi:hypothetical protein